MPWAPPRPCRWPGCAALVPSTERSPYCNKHRARRFDEFRKPERPSFYGRGYPRTWPRIRRAYLAEHPLCEPCHKLGRLTPATEVHHRDGNPANNAPENLMACCRSCHQRMTLAEQNRRRARGQEAR